MGRRLEGYHDAAKSFERIYLMALSALEWKIFSAKSPSQANALIGGSEEAHMRTTGRRSRVKK